MNRDFEIRQLLRAYRGGLMSETAFEEEMAQLEHETLGSGGAEDPGFEACGRRYRSEREAVLSFLDQLHVAQMDAATGFARWATVCRTPGLRTGLVMVAERAAYHVRVLERRVHELGGELHAVATERVAKLVEVFADREISDLDKLLALGDFVQDPDRAVEPIFAFASELKVDIQSKQALRLLADDQLSTAMWLQAACDSLTAMKAEAATAQRSVPTPA